MLADSATGEQWESIAQYDHDLGNSELVINRALKRIDYLDLVILMSVSVEIPNRKDVSLADAVEDDMAGQLGREGVIFARETYDTFVVIYAYGTGSKIVDVAKLPQRHGPAVYDVVRRRTTPAGTPTTRCDDSRGRHCSSASAGRREDHRSPFLGVSHAHRERPHCRDRHGRRSPAPRTHRR